MYWRDQSNREQPHERLLPGNVHRSWKLSAKESVIFLSLLLCQIDLFLEVRIWDDLLQGGSDLRIKRLEVREQISKIDRLRSSTEVAISTSVIQRIDSEG